MDEELKRMVEAILFAAARKIELAELAKLCKRPEQEIFSTLSEWKTQLDTNPGPITLLQDGTAWKLSVREKYLSIIKKVVTKTELPKSILETLAVVAYKAPVLQSKVIKVRTNKAYDHLRSLEDSLLITREKSGRTKLIKLTPKFFEYFDIDPRKLREKFSNSGDIEKAIEAKEKEGEDIEQSRRKQTAEQLENPQIDLHGVQVYDAVVPVDTLEPTGVEIFMEKLGELETFDVPRESMKPEELAELEILHPHKKHHHKKTKKHPHATHHPTHPHIPHEHTTAKPTITPETPAAEEKMPEQAPEQPTETPPQEKPATPLEQLKEAVQKKTKRMKERTFETGGIETSQQQETEIEKKVNEILAGKKEETETNEEGEIATEEKAEKNEETTEENANADKKTNETPPPM